MGLQICYSLLFALDVRFLPEFSQKCVCGVVYKKILILGNGGSGKSTLACQLKQLTGWPVLHLDSIYWETGYAHARRDVFINKVSDFCKKEAWIVEGTPMPGLEYRVSMADVVVFIDAITIRCLARIIKRWFFSFCFRKSDLTSCPALKLDWKSLRWVCSFNKRIRPKVFEAVGSGKQVDIVLLRGKLDTRLFLRSFISM